MSNLNALLSNLSKEAIDKVVEKSIVGGHGSCSSNSSSSSDCSSSSSSSSSNNSCGAPVKILFSNF